MKFVRRLRKKLVPRSIRRLSAQVAALGAEQRAAPAAQILLRQHYRDLVARGVPLPSLRDVGFRCRSQFDEDGILLYLFAVLGETNRVAVEICAGDGIQCNAANLILNHGWHGLLFDGDEASVRAGRKFFERHPDTYLDPPRFERAWITAENVNDLVAGAGVVGEIDLLSLDIDGMDYWVWKALEAVRPRVVVCETQSIVPPGRAVTAPYDPQFRIETPDFYGVSPTAMQKLMTQKGYRLVGAHRHGFNAFYVRADLGTEHLPTVTVEACVDVPYSRRAMETRWPKVRDLPWTEV